MAKALPDCVDSAGNHLNYTAATNAFSCGTTGAAAGATVALDNLASVAVNAPIGLGGTATTFPSIEWNTTQTVDTGMLLTGSTSNHWVMAERADGGYDFAHAATTNPTLFIHSADQSTTKWVSLSHNGTYGVLDAGTSALQIGGSSGLDFNGNSMFFGQAQGLGRIFNSTGQTPDIVAFTTGPTSNSFIVMEDADRNGDFQNGPCGTAACTTPTVVIRSATLSDTASYSGLSYSGIAGKVVKALTAASATAVVTIPIAAATGTGGKIIYTVFASDATDHQVRTGMVTYAGVNKAATETCAINGVDALFTANPTELLDGSAAGAMSAGTLTYAWTASNSPTNGCQFLLNAVSSLTETTLQIQYQVIQAGPGEVLPQ